MLPRPTIGLSSRANRRGRSHKPRVQVPFGPVVFVSADSLEALSDPESFTGDRDSSIVENIQTICKTTSYGHRTETRTDRFGVGARTYGR